MQNFLCARGLRPETSCLQWLGALPPDPQLLKHSPLQISENAPGVFTAAVLF